MPGGVRDMRGLLGRLCGRGADTPAPNSPLRGAGRRQPGDFGAGQQEASHVRFQDSDLDEIEALGEREDNTKTENNNDKFFNTEIMRSVIKENDDEDSEDVYSKVFEDPDIEDTGAPPKSNSDSFAAVPKPAIRRKKRRGRHEAASSSHQTQAKHVTFDWLAGVREGEAEAGSQVAVLQNMVTKLSLELGREQSRRGHTGLQLDQLTASAPWLADLGGLVPLLVAYEEELREVRQSAAEGEEVAGRDRARLEELLQDNTEMATQLHSLAKLGPVDYEEFRVIRESAALVLEENSLLKESEADVAMKLEKIQEESNDRLNIAAEEIAKLKKDNSRLTARNKLLEVEIEEVRQNESRIKSELTKSIPIDTHSKAVGECQSAFEELKQNYEKETEEKSKIILILEKDLSDKTFSIEKLNSQNCELETDLKISKKMMGKYEELCLSLQDKMMVLAKNRAEAEEFARKCEEDAEAAKVEAEALARIARQQRAAEKAADRDRTEEGFVLEKLQQRMRELKISMGGHIKQLELELKKSEASKCHIKHHLELELKSVKKELEVQKKISEKYRIQVQKPML